MQAAQGPGCAGWPSGPRGGVAAGASTEQAVRLRKFNSRTRQVCDTQREAPDTRLADPSRCIECSRRQGALVRIRLGGLCPCRPGCSLLLSCLEVVVLQQNLVDHPKHARADGDGTDGPPGWPKAVQSAALEAAGSSTRGSGWAPSGRASSPGSAEQPRAGRRALRRRKSRAQALPRSRMTLLVDRKVWSCGVATCGSGGTSMREECT